MYVSNPVLCIVTPLSRRKKVRIVRIEEREDKEKTSDTYNPFLSLSVLGLGIVLLLYVQVQEQTFPAQKERSVSNSSLKLLS